ncbi:MAG TPA: collagen-like protein, partial [Bacteroidia bacterium]|nr:collagen-like protein [Bacteroidia bacterium]
MKNRLTKFIALFIFSVFGVFLTQNTQAQNNVGIGTNTPAATSILELKSTSQGMLVPRLTAVQRLAIVAPSNSLLVFDTDTGCFFYWNALTTQWVSLCRATSAGAPGPTGPAGANGATGPAGANGATG